MVRKHENVTNFGHILIEIGLEIESDPPRLRKSVLDDVQIGSWIDRISVQHPQDRVVGPDGRGQINLTVTFLCDCQLRKHVYGYYIIL